MTRWRERFGGLLVDAGGVLACWIVLLALENLVVGLRYRDLFAGSWEMALARSRVSPIAFALLAPVSLGVAALGRLAERTATDTRARTAALALAGILGGVLGFFLSTGRHFQSWAIRAPFVLALAAALGAGAFFALPVAAPASRRFPRTAAALGAVLAVAVAYVDATVLPRLYPAFHVALFGMTLTAAALPCVALEGATMRRKLAWGVWLFAALCAAWTPRAAAGLRSADNLRLVLLEHAPLLGRAVRFATFLAPPVEDDATDSAAVTHAARSLDWTGRDVLVVSIDALRADHVGAYGYARPTTPNLDALAREGVLFEAAYCPTPHTSYSVTSMMTGKYMRPLLSLGVGEDSETWAAHLRRYGYRTAAFYPPAVFFIDPSRFASFEARGLDFEYRKVEFAPSSQRASQLSAYVASQPAATPLFVWVHLFEPHEPYVMHPAHPFGAPSAPTDVDAYDSEIAEADAGLGEIVATFRKARPGGVVIVTADHGEEFGEHGGHYHGTTVYEEQVRVPLVIVGPNVTPRKVGVPVQTIDLLPTTLSALGLPPQAKIRGRDIGPLATGVAKEDPGMAFAETEDYTLYARGKERLVCVRKAAACALYDVGQDPREKHDLGAERPDVARDLRKATRGLERDVSRYEAGSGADLPEALRRGRMGEGEAALDVAALLDDARPDLRRAAAEVLFKLRRPESAPALARALSRDEDDEVRRFAALALVRLGQPPAPLAEALRNDPDVAWRRRAALAFAETGDGRSGRELVQWFAEGALAGALPFEETRELLQAIAKARPEGAAPVVVRALSDVRLRPDVAETLGALADPRAKGPLLAAFSNERFVSARAKEAHALLRLGARSELAAPLTRFAGVPKPMEDVLEIAKKAGLLTPDRGGFVASSPRSPFEVTLRAPEGPARLFVEVDGRGPLRGRLGKEALEIPTDRGMGTVRVELSAGTISLHLEGEAVVSAVWLVPLADEIPPPPPVPWDAGAADAGDEVR